VNFGTDLNVPIDSEGNIPIMFFIAVGDYFSTTYLLEQYRAIDLSWKNAYGINATYLSLLMDPDEKDLHRLTTNHSSFDYYFVDPTNNYCNLLMHFIMREVIWNMLTKVVTFVQKPDTIAMPCQWVPRNPCHRCH